MEKIKRIKFTKKLLVLIIVATIALLGAITVGAYYIFKPSIQVPEQYIKITSENGNEIVTEKNADGSASQIVTSPDGTVTTTFVKADGTAEVTTKAADGKTETIKTTNPVIIDSSGGTLTQPSDPAPTPTPTPTPTPAPVVVTPPAKTNAQLKSECDAYNQPYIDAVNAEVALAFYNHANLPPMGDPTLMSVVQAEVARQQAEAQRIATIPHKDCSVYNQLIVNTMLTVQQYTCDFWQ